MYIAVFDGVIDEVYRTKEPDIFLQQFLKLQPENFFEIEDDDTTEPGDKYIDGKPMKDQHWYVELNSISEDEVDSNRREIIGFKSTVDEVDTTSPEYENWKEITKEQYDKYKTCREICEWVGDELREVVDLEELRRIKLSELETKVNAMKLSGFSYNELFFSVDDKAYDRMKSVMIGVLAGGDVFPIPWITRNSGESGVLDITDKDMWTAFYAEASKKIFEIETMEATTKLKIEIAETEDELNAITI